VALGAFDQGLGNMRLKITVLPGDGIGPEVTREAVRVLREVAGLYELELAFEERAIGGAAIERYGNPLPRETLDACLASDAVLLGAVGAPAYDALAPHARPEAGLLALRQALGAYANLRPARFYDAIAKCSPLRPEVARGADVLIVRELLGGLYFGAPRGFDDVDPAAAAFNTMRYSAGEVERVARVAFEAARSRRGKVTSVDKANVLETSQLWRAVVTRVARDYPGVRLEHVYVDAFAMHLVTRPTRFDVVLTENLFGDILSDEAAVLTGSLGMLPSASIGGDVGLYEPVHGSAPDIAGRGEANPLGAIASVALLLRYSAKLEQAARDVEEAICAVLEEGHRTPDLFKGPGEHRVTTAQMGSLVVEAVAETVDRRHAYFAV
jgi:3-isopropylmalate dehydrogenase